MMARKSISAESRLALRRLVSQEMPGTMDVHMNLVIDQATSDVLNALVADTNSNLTNRSKAARHLMLRGAQATLDAGPTSA